MTSLFKIAHRFWTTPLDRMTYHGAGCCNLPVEIWKEIFTLACAFEVAPALLEYELITPLSTGISSTCQGPNILSEFLELQKPALFAMRRSIVLVCKAWYYMGASMLHAHIRIDLIWTAEKLERLYQSLRENRNFASSVARLSIIGSKAYTGDRSRITGTPRKDKAFKKISNILHNLHIITIPYQLARGEYPFFRPDIALIYSENRTESRLAYDPLTYGPQWWHYCTTLSLTFPSEPYRSVGEENADIAPIFPNLVNLFLNIYQIPSIKWIISEWTLPVLKNFSITSPEPHYWVGFIKKFNRTLERLEILREDWYWSMTYPSNVHPPFIMHRLKDLCLSLRLLPNDPDPLQAWMDHIKAPVLQRFSIHVSSLEPSMTAPNYLRDRMASVPRAYPTVKILGVCYHTGETYSPNSHQKMADCLREEDIENWCEYGATVELTKLGGRDRSVYSRSNTK